MNRSIFVLCLITFGFVNSAIAQFGSPSSPYAETKFQDYLEQCKFQAPLSTTAATADAIIGGFSSANFSLVDTDKMGFYQVRDADDNSQRAELRNNIEWLIDDGIDRTFHANLDIISQADGNNEVTFMQIHDVTNNEGAVNKPLIRIYKSVSRDSQSNHLWAAYKTDATGDATTHIDLGADPGGYFDCDIIMEGTVLKVNIDGTVTTIADVDYWTFYNYFKNGVYLQDVGNATVYFNELTLTTSVTSESETNLALNKTVTQSGSDDGNVPENIVDGDPGTRWSSNGFPKSATVDLGADYSIDKTEVICYSDRAYQYTISVSDTEFGTYTDIVDRESNTTQGTVAAPIEDNFSAVNARFVKINVTGAVENTPWVSLIEFRIFEAPDAFIDVTGISVTPETSAIEDDETLQLTTTFSPANATNQTVGYLSSDGGIATVDYNGLVTAVSAGTVTITAISEDGSFTDTSVITISEAIIVPVTGVSLTPETASVYIDNSVQLVAEILPNNATEMSVTYSSNNTNVATVSSDGVVTGVTNGSATITVTTVDGSFTDTSIITVLTPSNINLALTSEGATATATDAQDPNNPINLLDGNSDGNVSRWSASGYPQSATIDLGHLFTLSHSELVCYSDRAYQYTISVSTNGIDFTDLEVGRESNTTPGTEASPIIDQLYVDAQYVKITVSGAAVYEQDWVSLAEFRIFGTSVLAVDALNLENEVSLYPNPATDYVVISGAVDFDSVEVYDQVGNLILRKAIDGESIDISNLNTGMYIFRISGEKGTIVKRVIKK